jgi:AraC family transcriptional regulator of adaptative response / DNA-3-methyladenine glycosylase II
MSEVSSGGRTRHSRLVRHLRRRSPSAPPSFEERALDNGSVNALASSVGIGARHLNRLFAQHVGASPLAVAQTRRLHFAKRLIDETALPMTAVALAAGFGSLRRCNATFQETYGRTPRDLRKRRGDPTSDEVILTLAFRPPYDWAHVRDFLARRAVPMLLSLGVAVASFFRL